MIHELGEQLQAFMFALSVESCDDLARLRLICKNFNSNVFPHVAHGLRNMRCWRNPGTCASSFVRDFGPLCITSSTGGMEEYEWETQLLWIADIWKKHSKMQVLTVMIVCKNSPWIVKQIKLV
jgi:hypothetical protein